MAATGQKLYPFRLIQPVLAGYQSLVALSQFQRVTLPYMVLAKLLQLHHKLTTQAQQVTVITHSL